MAYVPKHLLEESKYGVMEINISVKLMRNGEEYVDQNIPCPAEVNVNLDGRNTNKDRPQQPHIGFSVQARGQDKVVSYVFVMDALPTNITIRPIPPRDGNSKRGDFFDTFSRAPTVTPRGKASTDEWHVEAVIHRPKTTPPPKEPAST